VYDFLIQNARITPIDMLVDIAITNSHIVAIGPQLQEVATRILDVEGRIVLPGLVEGHIHLDKALTCDRIPNRSGTLAEAIRRNQELSHQVTQDDIYARAHQAALWALSCGTTTIRTHVNVDPFIELRGLHALCELREQVRHLLDIQIVALPHRLIGPTGRRGRELLASALKEGADAIGGAPLVDDDQRAFVDEVFAMALRYGKPIDLHVDESESPGDFVLGYLAKRTIQEGYEGRVVAGHCCSLAAVDEITAAHTIEQVARARISVVTLPATNLYLQGRHDPQPVRRGLTRVKELIAAGVNVFCGSDNIKDIFNPFGKPDLLLMAHILGYAAQMGGWDEQEYLLESVTTRPAAALGVASGLLAGAPADLVVLEAQRYHDVLSDLPARYMVIKRGHVVVVEKIEVCLDGGISQGSAPADTPARCGH